MSSSASMNPPGTPVADPGEHELTGDPDPCRWADQFMLYAGQNPGVTRDWVTLHTWFAAAIVTGRRAEAASGYRMFVAAEIVLVAIILAAVAAVIVLLAG